LTCIGFVSGNKLLDDLVLTLSVWQLTWTELSVGCLNAVVHSFPEPKVGLQWASWQYITRKTSYKLHQHRRNRCSNWELENDQLRLRSRVDEILTWIQRKRKIRVYIICEDWASWSATCGIYGEISVRSVLEPHPVQAVLTSVVSTIVHPSPLNPQVPFCRYLAELRCRTCNRPKGLIIHTQLCS